MTEQKLLAAKQMIAEGHSIRAAARAVGCSHTALRYRLQPETRASKRSYDKSYGKEWYQQNRERKLAQTAVRQKNNPVERAASVGKTRAKRLGRLPSWLTPEQLLEMRAFYQKAWDLTQETGVLHEVDHIYPLKGETVSGLHVPSNLQVLTRSENCKKGNSMPETGQNAEVSR